MDIDCLKYLNIVNLLFSLKKLNHIDKNQLKSILNLKKNIKYTISILLDSFLLKKKTNQYVLGITGKNFLSKNKNASLSWMKRFILFSLLTSKDFSMELENLLLGNSKNYQLLIEYQIISKNSQSINLTKFGFQLSLMLNAINDLKEFGRNKFTQKNSLSVNELKEVSIFVRKNKRLFQVSNFTEALTIKSIIDKNLLVGGKELLYNLEVEKLRQFITDNYSNGDKSKIALLIPCSKTKPYTLSPTTKAILNKVYSIIGKNNHIIDFFVVSEPIGLIPLEYEIKYPASSYDMTLPGWLHLEKANRIKRGNGEKIFQTINENSQKNDNLRRDQREIINFLSEEIGKFLLKQSKKYNKIIAYVRSTHRQMIEITNEKYDLEIEIIPSKKDIREIIKKKGQIYWAFQGLRSPYALKVLENEIEKNL